MKFLERAFDGQNQFWKYLLVILIVFFAAQFVGALPLLVVMISKVVQSGGAVMPNLENPMDLAHMGINSNLGLFLMIIPFLISLIVLVLLVKAFHRRTLSEIINGRKKIRWSRFLWGAGVWAIITAVYLIVDYLLAPDNFTIQFNLGSFVVLVLISVLFIPFQASFEEILFRGYLAQGLGVWTKSRWWVLLITSLLFALMHSANPEVKEFGFLLSMSQYLTFGLIFGLISILDDGVELAMGVHSANNVLLSIFVTHKASALQTEALLVQSEIFPVKDALTLLLMGIICVAFFAMKYKWNFSIMNRKIASNN